MTNSFAVLTFEYPTCNTPETTIYFDTKAEATKYSNTLAESFTCAEVRDVVGGCMVSRNYPNAYNRLDSKALQLWNAKDSTFWKYRRSNY